MNYICSVLHIHKMKKTERILLIIIFIAIVFLHFRIAGGTFLMMLAGMILSILYAYFSLGLLNELSVKEMFKKSSYKDISTWRIVGSVLVGFVLSVVIVAVLFQVLSWKGRIYMFLLASLGIVISFIVALIQYQKKKADFYGHLLVRLGFYLLMLLVFSFVTIIELPQ